jgi:diguanylate cyclase (GGDEF)-like protein
MLVKSKLLLVIGVFVAIASAFFVGWLLHKIETRSAINEFHSHVSDELGSIEREISISFDVIYSLGGLYNASEEVTAEEFNLFASDILRRYPHIQALEWAPVVHTSQRDQFEKKLQDVHSTFVFTERNAQNQLVKAKQRDFYYPVYYVEPLLTNEAALGFDLGSNPTRLASLQRAAQTGKLIVTPSIQLVQDEKITKGFLVILPIYNGSPNTIEQRIKKLQGYVIGVFRIRDVLDQAIHHSSVNDINFTLLDMTADPPELLYQQGLRDTSNSKIISENMLTPFGERQWALIAKPSESYIAEKVTALPYILAMFIFTTTLTALGYAFLTLRRADEVEKAVLGRTEELNAAKVELERLTLIDGLTGIANRRHFNDFIKREWAHAMRSRKPISVIMVDVDHFKAYNDHYGHSLGDNCLKEVAKTLNATVHRTTDLLARYGGEEFVIVLPETKDAMPIAELCRENIEALQMLHESSSTENVVTASFGCATLIPSPDIHSSYKTLVTQADEALYAAKSAGRNCCKQYTPIN